VTGTKDVVEMKFTKKELATISLVLARVTVRVIDAPEMIALVNKVADMIEGAPDGP